MAGALGRAISEAQGSVKPSGPQLDKHRIAAAMQEGDTKAFEEIPSSFNVAPQTFQPVVRLTRISGERELALMRWGLIPWCVKDSKIGFKKIKVKAETLSSSLGLHRCRRRSPNNAHRPRPA
jgi:putative SOS response-associated peptidase YedK